VLARAETPDQAAAIGKQCGGRVFLFLETDDFARDHARMLAAGVVFEELPRHEPYGLMALWPYGRLARPLGQPLGPDRTLRPARMTLDRWRKWIKHVAIDRSAKPA
jgi:hypothetical protein